MLRKIRNQRPCWGSTRQENGKGVTNHLTKNTLVKSLCEKLPLKALAWGLESEDPKGQLFRFEENNWFPRNSPNYNQQAREPKKPSPYIKTSAGSSTTTCLGHSQSLRGNAWAEWEAGMRQICIFPW